MYKLVLLGRDLKGRVRFLQLVLRGESDFDKEARAETRRANLERLEADTHGFSL